MRIISRAGQRLEFEINGQGIRHAATKRVFHILPLLCQIFARISRGSLRLWPVIVYNVVDTWVYFEANPVMNVGLQHHVAITWHGSGRHTLVWLPA